MKKIFLLLIILVLLFSFSACSINTQDLDYEISENEQEKEYSDYYDFEISEDEQALEYDDYNDFEQAIKQAEMDSSNKKVETSASLERISSYVDFNRVSDDWELNTILVKESYVIVEYITKEEKAPYKNDYMTIKWDRNDYGESFEFLDWALSTFPNYKEINVETSNGVKTVVKGEVYNGEDEVQAYAYFWIENEKMLTAHCPPWYVDKYSDTIILETMERIIYE